MSSDRQTGSEHYREVGKRFVYFTVPIYTLFFLIIIAARHLGLSHFSDQSLWLSLFHIAGIEALTFLYCHHAPCLNRQDIKQLLWLLIINNMPFFCFWTYHLGEIHSIMYMIAITCTMSLFTIATLRQSLLYNGILALLLLLTSYLASAGGSHYPMTTDIIHIGVLLCVSAWLSFLADVFTRQRHKLSQVVEDLHASQEALAQESHAKNEFFAKMSHEIRTPMNGVLGMLQLLIHDETDKDKQHYLHTAHNSGRALLAVINDILDFSKIEAGAVQLEHISFDLPQLLEECATVFTPNANEKNLQLLTDIKPNLPQWVIGDPSRLRQIIMNLLSNAIKFTELGQVTLLVSLSQTDQEKEQGEQKLPLLISIIDSGIGISEQQQQHLFTSFQQADSSTTRRFGGTGLGLSICKQLIELMHGKISITSSAGHGARFDVELTLRRSNEQQSVLTQESPCIAKVRLRALVVDDNKVNRMVIQAMLGKLDIDNLLFSSGLAFLDHVKKHHESFDVILMDCEMPGIDGFEATRLYRQWESQQGSQRKTIIALTAHNEESYFERCLQQGMNHTLVKPLDMDELVVLLQHIQKDA